MRIVNIEGFEIHYQVVVARKSGYTREKCDEVYYHNALSRERAELIAPEGSGMALFEVGSEEEDGPSWANGPITFNAIGSVDGSQAKQGMSLTLGFVQNLTASERKVLYDDNHRFEQKHDGYPVKDGHGHPWYKEPSEKFDHSSRKVEFSLQAADEPHFSFPITMHGGTVALKVRSIEMHDEYHCCLVAKLVEEQTGFATLHFLHSIVWKMDVSLLSGTGGITVTLETPISHPPAMFTTIGEAANDTQKKYFDGTPAL